MKQKETKRKIIKISGDAKIVDKTFNNAGIFEIPYDKENSIVDQIINAKSPKDLYGIYIDLGHIFEILEFDKEGFPSKIKDQIAACGCACNTGCMVSCETGCEVSCTLSCTTSCTETCTITTVA